MNTENQIRIQEILREFQERAFGDELARVNELPRDERWAYIQRIWDEARQRGLSGPHGPARIWDWDED